MDIAEALGFIGLQEPLNEDAVLSKYHERFNYFQMLYTNAPNKVIEKIQQQNIEKLNQVKRLLLNEIAIKKRSFNQKFTVPTAEKSNLSSSTQRQVVGWLIVHTENKKIET